MPPICGMKRSAKPKNYANPPQSNQAQTVHSCIEQLDLLARDLARIAKTTTDKTQIPAIREDVQRVVQSLTGLKAQL